MSLITVIIPVYNRVSYLERTFASLRNQTYRPFRIILVDNNSNDASLSLCYRLQAENSTDDFRIDVLQELKPGANAARNKGLKEAVSPWVMFFDSDDELVPDALQRIADAIERYPVADVVGFTAWLRFPDGRMHKKRHCFSVKIEDQIVHTMFSTQCYVARTDTVKAIGGWDEDLQAWQDWNMGIRLLMHTRKVVWLKHPSLVIINRHSDSITGDFYIDSMSRHEAAIDKTATLLAESNYPRKKEYAALAHARRLFLAGRYRKENNREQGDRMFDTLMQILSPTIARRKIWRMLYWYVSRGGRGQDIIIRRLIR